MTKEENNAYRFIRMCEDYGSEEELLNLIRSGIDVHYHKDWLGDQRYDDGNYWGESKRLVTYALYRNSAKVMEELLKEPEIGQELVNRNQEIQVDGNHRNWLRNIFYNLRPASCAQSLPILLASPMLRNAELFEKGIECPLDDVVVKLLLSDQLEKWKLDILLKSERINIPEALRHSMKHLYKEEDLITLLSNPKLDPRVFKFATSALSEKDALQLLLSGKLKGEKLEYLMLSSSMSEAVENLENDFKDTLKSLSKGTDARNELAQKLKEIQKRYQSDEVKAVITDEKTRLGLQVAAKKMAIGTRGKDKKRETDRTEALTLKKQVRGLQGRLKVSQLKKQKIDDTEKRKGLQARLTELKKEFDTPEMKAALPKESDRLKLRGTLHKKMKKEAGV